MNAVDVIKWEVSEQELVHKFESDELRLGSQLLVYPAQTAFFVKGGKILDEFGSGTYTIKSENIPLLGKVINIPFNGETPFKAEVWFVNQVSILNNKWGTMTPIQVEDPKYDVIVPVRAYGQYGMRVENPRLLIERLVGNMATFETARVADYFKGVLLSKLTRIVYDALRETQQSVLNISSQVERLSEFAADRLREDFANYGVGLEMFSIISISVKEDDPSFVALKEAKDMRARINVIGRDDYQMTRSFDVLEQAAGNQSGMAGAAMGLGAGFGLAKTAATMAAGTINLNPSGADVPPPLPTKTFFLAIDGRQQGPFAFDAVASKIANAEISPDTLAWTKGMTSWTSISALADFKDLFSDDCPPPLPTL